MLTDEFLNAKAKRQNALIKRVKEYIDSLELRTSLDEISQDPKMLDPSIPIPPPQPPMPQGMPGQIQPQGAPQAPTQSGQMSMPPLGQPIQQPSVRSIFSGTGIPNMATPQTPTSISSIPAF